MCVAPVEATLNKVLSEVGADSSALQAARGQTGFIVGGGGGGRQPGGGGGGGEAELASRTLQVEHKLFYLDLKQNGRGRYLKISEKAAGARSTVIVPLAGVVWFVDLFNYYANGADAELSSKELQLDTKVFYFDVGENPRGRFLKVSEASVTRNRSVIIVPAGAADEGWAAFRNVLVEIHEEAQRLPLPPPSPTPRRTGNPQHLTPMLPLNHHLGGLPKGVGSGAYVGGGVGGATGEPAALPEHLGNTADFGSASAGAAPAAGPDSSGSGHGGGSGQAGLSAAKVIRVEHKKFFFDLGSNNRGQYLRISEVAGCDRSAIILPVSALEQFHETLGWFLEMVRVQDPSGTQRAAIAGASNGGRLVVKAAAST
eukprot:SM000166S02451  [mRNA]  locus=s166:42445:48496:+ [translate_table: standard]